MSIKSKRRNEAHFILLFQRKRNDAIPKKKIMENPLITSVCVLREKVCFNAIIYSTRLLLFPLQRYRTSSSSSSSPPQEVTQVNAVSSSTDCLGKRGRILAPPLRPGLQGPLPFNITSPCLERLLQAKESIVTPYVAGGCSRRL